MGVSRYLVWYISRPVRGGVGVGERYYLPDSDYELVRVDLYTKKAPVLQNCIFDVLDDGVSLFNTSGRPTIVIRQVKGNGFFTPSRATVRKGSVLTLNIDQLDGDVGDITITLELEKRE